MLTPNVTSFCLFCHFYMTKFLHVLVCWIAKLPQVTANKFMTVIPEPPLFDHLNESVKLCKCTLGGLYRNLYRSWLVVL